jgi:Phage integrase, N-terminal SAM-like domain
MLRSLRPRERLRLRQYRCWSPLGRVVLGCNLVLRVELRPELSGVNHPAAPRFARYPVVVSRWTPEHAATLALSTRASYAAVYGKHIAPCLDDLPLREITVSVLRRWQANLIAAGVGHGAIMRARAVLSSMLRHAAESEAIPANPLTLVRAPRAPYREQVRPLAPATVERIRALSRRTRRNPGERARVCRPASGEALARRA